MFSRGIIFTAVWCAAIAGCGAPPAGTNDGGADLDGALGGTADGGLADASVIDGGVVADAQISDAMPPDAMPPDACVPYVPPDGDAGADNPHGITLTDVTLDMATQFGGGRALPANLAFGAGTLLADLDGDGDLDVILARIDSTTGGPPELLENQGGFFNLVARPEFAMTFAGLDAHAASAADYDGDGDLDVFLGFAGENVLLRNDGGLVFTDVTAVAGVGGLVDAHTSNGVWADLNADGLVDLYVTNHLAELGGYDERIVNHLYLNRGDGSFDDVTEIAGVGGLGSTHAALIADLDSDGVLDIYVANDRFASDGLGGNFSLDGDRFYKVNHWTAEGVPVYWDISQAVSMNDPRSAMGIALADIDHNGIDDLYVSDIGRNHTELWNPAGPSYVSDFGYYGLQARYIDQGPDYLVSWGARFQDLDRDGWLEAFVVNGYFGLPVSCKAQLQRDLYFRSTGGVYSEVTSAVGLPAGWECPVAEGDPIGGRGLVSGDIDGDGDDDFVIAPYDEVYRFYRNDTPSCGRPAARVRLVGSVSSAEAIGAALEVRLANGQVMRRVQYAGGDTYSQSERVHEVSLVAAPIQTIKVIWPSGLVQDVAALPSFDDGGVITIDEPEWLSLSAKVATASDPGPVLTVRLFDDAGQWQGAAGAGKLVEATRSDGQPVTVIDVGDGSYTAALVHPGSPVRVGITVAIEGVAQRPRFWVEFK